MSGREKEPLEGDGSPQKKTRLKNKSGNRFQAQPNKREKNTSAVSKPD